MCGAFGCSPAPLSVLHTPTMAVPELHLPARSPCCCDAPNLKLTRLTRGALEKGLIAPGIFRIKHSIQCAIVPQENGGIFRQRPLRSLQSGGGCRGAGWGRAAVPPGAHPLSKILIALIQHVFLSHKFPRCANASAKEWKTTTRGTASAIPFGCSAACELHRVLLGTFG